MSQELMSTVQSNALATAKQSETQVVLAQAKIELEVKYDRAERNPRSITPFMDAAIGLATYSEEIAASCIFSLPRKMKNAKTGQYEQGYIKGKSIRLAEILLSVYKNIDIKVVEGAITGKTATSVATIIDLQTNTTFSEPGQANINGTHADAIKLAVAASRSIALRNVALRLIPGAFSEVVYKKAVECAVGDQVTFPVRRKEIFSRIAKLGIPQEKIFAFYGKNNIEDYTPDNMEEIVGIGTAIKEKEIKIDQAFVKAAKAEEENENINDLIAEKNNVTVEKKHGTKKDAEVINMETGEVLQPQSAPVSEIDKVRHQLEKASSLETLQIAADLIRECSAESQAELTLIYHNRLKEFKQ